MSNSSIGVEPPCYQIHTTLVPTEYEKSGQKERHPLDHHQQLLRNCRKQARLDRKRSQTASLSSHGRPANVSCPEPGKRSILLRLPTEILEQIFLLSLNPGLIQASPLLATRLSSLYVRKRFCTPWLNGQIVYEPQKHLNNWSTDWSSIAATQNFILRQNFLTVDFIWTCMIDYATELLVEGFGALELHWLRPDGPLINPESGSEVRDWVHKVMIAYDSELFDEKQVATWTEHETGASVRLSFSPFNGIFTFEVIRDDLSTVGNICLLGGLCGDSGTVIPDRILSGPWTDEKIALLKLLLNNTASIDWLNSLSGEIAEQGFQEAIVERNPRALRGLMQPMYETTRPWELAQIYSGVYSKGCKQVGIAPNQGDLKLAIAHGSSRNVIETLLTCPDSVIDLHDRELTRLLVNRPELAWLLEWRRKEEKQRREQRSRRGNHTGVHD